MSIITSIRMPQWGLEMTEGTLSSWRVSVGDVLEKGTEIADIETAKIVNTLEASPNMLGVVRRLVANVGDTVVVGGLLAVLADASVSDEQVDAFIRSVLGEEIAPPVVAEEPEAPAVAPLAAPVSTAPVAAAVAANISSIRMPQWGLEMTEGTLSNWRVSVGDSVRKGSEIADIETAKIVNALEAGQDMGGVIRRLVANIGDIIPVGGLLAVVADSSVSDADIEAFVRSELGEVATPAPVTQVVSQAPISAPSVVAVEAPAAPAATKPVIAGQQPASDAEQARVSALNSSIVASPVALRLANRYGIELQTLQGTGRHGRVSVDDLVAQAGLILGSSAEAPAQTSNLVQSNATVKASPVALRLANSHGIDLRAVKATGRNGRVSVEDLASFIAPVSASPAVCQGEAESCADKDGLFRAGPVARRLAAELGFDLADLVPTGPKDTVRKEDVREAFRAALSGATSPAQSAAIATPDFELIPLTPMRKAIANSLTQSKQTIPHFYLTVDLRMDALLELREKMNGRLAPGQKKLSVNDFVMRAVALSLIEVPDANVHYTEQGIKRFSSAHVCVAVAIEGGLVTPVLRNAEQKSLQTLAKETVSLAQRARDRALKSDELQGGTFTVSNLGMFGVRQFDAVINPPQGGILAVGGLRRECYEKADGSAGFCSVMTVTMSCDHRVIDGAVGANFLRALRELIESPYSLIG
jgi:pyruvate dehydrogenase E2 component (dihydrolipoamide acetyltransferase)